MEKDLQILHQNCYDFLTSKNFHTAEKIGEFYLEVFEIAKQKCNMPDLVCKIDYNEEDDAISYNAQQKTLYINPRLAKKRHIAYVVSEIFRTVCLEQQNSQIEYKQLGVAKPVEIPLEKTNNHIHYLRGHDTGLNTYALAYTSKNNKQARDFANTQALEFFKQMGKLADSNSATDRQKKFIEIQRQKVFKNYKKEKYEYFDFIKEVDIPKSIYESCFRTIIWDSLNQLRSNYLIMNYEQCLPDEKEQAKENLKFFNIKIQAITQAFCDDFYKKEILFYCKQYELIEPLYHLFNSSYSCIQKNDFNILFTVAEKQNISIEQVTQNLDCWKKELVENLYQKYCEKTKNEPDEILDLF